MFKTIMVAHDGSEASDGAFEYAVELAKSASARVVVVHVRQVIAGRGAGPLHLDQAEREARIRHQVEALRERGVEAEMEVHSSVSAPSRVLVRAAERAGADIVIAGTGHHLALASVILGSVPPGLLRRMSCPLLTVPAAV
ncbi:MAG: universal stress protein, partial [Gaiellales bacterium]